MFLNVAVDTAGGDLGPPAVILGIEYFLKKSSSTNIHFLLFGDQEEIKPLLNDAILLKKHCTVIHAEKKIASDAKVSDVLRQASETSLGMAIDSVAQKKAHVVVSSGNTGVFMALSKIRLKTFQGIDRPAIPCFLPTLKGQTLMMDLGANIECTPKMLLQFALMGTVYSSIFLKKEKPSVALLNIGVEHSKGVSLLQEAAILLKENKHIDYKGFIEGNDILKGDVDIVITDGFTGNISLKSIEGTSAFIYKIFYQYLSKSWRGRLGYLIAKPVLKKVFSILEQRSYNGAPFLGLQGLAVKSHGHSDAIGFANAIKVAIELSIVNLPQLVEEKLLESI